MAEYIEREAALEEFEKVCNLCMAIVRKPMCGDCSIADTVRKIKKIPAADVAPVRHGRWISDKKRLWYKCSNCGMEDMLEQDYSFCPFCGAKMEGEE